MIRSRTLRPGYTLLEILAATAIGVMLLAALYAAYDLTLKETATGRDLTAEADVSRAVVHRVGLDLVSAVGTLPPKSGQSSSSSGTSGGTTTATDTGTTTGTTTATTGTGTATATDTSAATGMTTTTDGSTTTTSAVVSGTDIPFQSGVVGGGPQLVVFASKPPKYLTDRGVAYDPTLVQPADLIRVVYYLHSQGKGLCRQEKPWVTADGVWNSSDPDRTNEDADLIAPEVVDVAFEFASGTGYVSEWDGSTSGTDGSACQGPPRAVKMTLTLEFAPPSAAATAQPVRKQVMHVFPIRAAVGPGPATTTTTTDSSTTTTTGTTGGN